jgi:lysozyme family protein
MTTDEIIDGILEREGSTFVNDPADKGGPTKFGITLGSWVAHIGHPATAKDIEALTEDDARAFYTQRYIVTPGFTALRNEWLRVFLIDTAVLEGTRTAIKMLQRVIDVKADGVLGPITLTALEFHVLEFGMPTLKRQLVTTRVNHLIGVALADIPREQVEATNLKWLHGWANRVLSFL